jgi:hypothetical protein
VEGVDILHGGNCLSLRIYDVLCDVMDPEIGRLYGAGNG